VTSRDVVIRVSDAGMTPCRQWPSLELGAFCFKKNFGSESFLSQEWSVSSQKKT